MKRFVFSLAAVLRSKEIVEHLRERELATVSALYLAEREKWEKLLQQQQDSASLVVPRCGAGRSLRAGEAQRWRDHILTLGEQAAAQEDKLQQIRQVVEKKREEVIAAARERQILERLKQKQFEAYQFEINRLQQAEIDEIAQRQSRAKSCLNSSVSSRL
jgi:flagellar FliJ protein